MLTNTRILEELSDEEGVKYKVYLCTANHNTVGIGHNLDAEPVDNIIGRHLPNNGTITQHELELIFEHDISKMKADLDAKLPWWKDLPVFAQYVILSLTFNMGIGGQIQKKPVKYNGLRGFVNTLAKFQSHDWEAAAAGLEKSKWFKQVGRRGKKLTNILRSGKFPDGKSE